MTSQWSGLVMSRDKWNTYLHLQKMYQYHNRQGADIVLEAPKHDLLIKWQTWGHVTVWKIHISIFKRFIANKVGSLLTLGRMFSTQTLKSSLPSCYKLIMVFSKTFCINFILIYLAYFIFPLSCFYNLWI